MSVRVLTSVFQHSEATLGGRLVLIAIADSAHDDGVGWPTVATLTDKTRMSERAVRGVIKDLESDGELEVVKVQRGQKRVNVYRVLMPTVDEVDYSRFPFEMPVPFLRPAKSAGGDRSNLPVTTGNPRPPLVCARDDSRTTKGKDLEPNVRGTARDEPPPIVKVGGRNVALDTLCRVTGVDEQSPRYQQAIVALSGRLDKRTDKVKTPGIRHLFWIECVRWAEEHDALDRLDLAYDEPAEWVQALSRRIEEKAGRYHVVYDGASISPKALCDHWLDLDLARERHGGMTADEIERYEL